MSAIPSWPRDTTGPRVLLECEDSWVQDGAERALREHGYAVATCGGPATRASGRCPLVGEGRCGLVEDADVIVHALDPHRAEDCEVLLAIKQRRPDTPVIIEVCESGDRRDPSLLAGTEHVRYPMSRERLVAAVEASISPATA